MTRIFFTDFVSTGTNLTLNEFNHRVKVTAACTITLPTAVGANAIGREYVIKALADNVIVNTTSSQTIDGALTKALIANDCLIVFSDGANWLVASLTQIGALPLLTEGNSPILTESSYILEF